MQRTILGQRATKRRACAVIALALLGCTSCGGADPATLAEERQKGLHCVVGGFSSEFVDAVKAQLRDPNSFEHVETRIAPVGPDGRHRIGMTFRSRNGFGGMNVQTAVGWVDHETCAATLEMIG